MAKEFKLVDSDDNTLLISDNEEYVKNVKRVLEAQVEDISEEDEIKYENELRSIIFVEPLTIVEYEVLLPDIKYETKFENGEPITSYLATAYAEGFEECSAIDTINAWSYLIGTGLAYSLQGWFGRQARSIIESGYIDNEGVVDWNLISDSTDG
jgi:hypothetical protein